jgi:hypothetical protein
MSALVWLAIPGVALVLAVLWVMWASRERPRVDPHDSVEEHERFKAAFDRRRPDAPPYQGRDRRRGGERRNRRTG